MMKLVTNFEVIGPSLDSDLQVKMNRMFWEHGEHMKIIAWCVELYYKCKGFYNVDFDLVSQLPEQAGLMMFGKMLIDRVRVGYFKVDTLMDSNVWIWFTVSIKSHCKETFNIHILNGFKDGRPSERFLFNHLSNQDLSNQEMILKTPIFKL